MAAIDMGGVLRFFFAPRLATEKKTRQKVHNLAVELHKRNGGPTPALKKIMQAHKDNKRSTVKVGNGVSAER